MATQSPTPPPSVGDPPNITTNPYDDEGSYALGYPRLALCFSQAPHYLHLRRFSALSIRLLLRRQSELILLERRILDLEIICGDYPKDQRQHRLNKDFRELGSDLKTPTEEGTVLVQLYEELERKIRDYGKQDCVLQRYGSVTY